MSLVLMSISFVKLYSKSFYYFIETWRAILLSSIANYIPKQCYVIDSNHSCGKKKYMVEFSHA